LAVTSTLCEGKGSSESSDSTRTYPELAQSKGDSKCLTKAYDPEKSKNGVKKGDKPTKVVYGSAELEGMIYEDSVCAIEHDKCFSL